MYIIHTILLSCIFTCFTSAVSCLESLVSETTSYRYMLSGTVSSADSLTCLLSGTVNSAHSLTCLLSGTVNSAHSLMCLLSGTVNSAQSLTCLLSGTVNSAHSLMCLLSWTVNSAQSLTCLLSGTVNSAHSLMCLWLPSLTVCLLYMFSCPPLMEITLRILEAFLQASRSYLSKHIQVSVVVIITAMLKTVTTLNIVFVWMIQLINSAKAK